MIAQEWRKNHKVLKETRKGDYTVEIHVVQSGETIWSIAQQYGESAQRIIQHNDVTNPRGLVPGQALIILHPETVYTVRWGDTLRSIAQRYGVSVVELLQNNPGITISSSLYPGQTIVIAYQGEKRREISVNGYAYPYINRNVLQWALPFLTDLTIFGYGFTLNGDLIPIDDQPLINLAYQYQAAPILLLSSITEDGNFSGERASRLFQDQELQNKVIDNVIDVMVEKGYMGIDVDFEYIEPQDSQAYVDFLKNVVAKMHEFGFSVNTDLAPKTSTGQKGLLYESHNYAAIGAVSDTVLLMTYEWGYTYGPPMAVAPLNQVEDVVRYAVTQIPPQKIYMGIPNYGYDWILPYERGITRATTIGNAYAVEIAARNHAEIQFDETAQSPHFTYQGPAGRTHVVWFEDVRSIQAKYDLMDRYSLMGAGYWNIMRPFAQNWAFLSGAYQIRKRV
jgi:spore germination protein